MSGLCECGCGRETNLAPRTDPAKGWVRGEPLRFIRGHVGGHRRRTLAEMYRVDPRTGCWEWLLARDGKDYGHYGSRMAHQVVYERSVGPIPVGLELDHLCRNHGCVNPAHLEPVTRAANVRRGAAAKLTWDDVRAIRATGGATKVAREALAAAYGVGETCIRSVLSHRAWWPEPS